MSSVIRVENVSKRYRLGMINRQMLYKDLQSRWARWRGQTDPNSLLTEQSNQASTNGEIWALKDIDFEIAEGEVVGIIGRNGSGKSTLLKILSQITAPTSGRVLLKGRVASLLEVGTGFHPELSGRDNIYLNGSILGMRRQEISRKFDEIVAFSEVAQFIDTPVKRYSSGMYMRLAFAVAAHLDPEILLVDEVLAVGDAEFQEKCLGKMNEVARGGKTVIFVSHNMGAVSALTSTCLHLQKGHLEDRGPTSQVVERYLNAAAAQHSSGKSTDLSFYRRGSIAESPAYLSRILVNGGQPGNAAVDLHGSLTVHLEINVLQSLRSAFICFTIKDQKAEPITTIFSWDQNFLLTLQPGIHLIEMKVDHIPFSPGYYYCDVGISRAVNAASADVIQNFPLFHVVNTGQVTHWTERPWGKVYCHGVHWSVLQNTACPS